MTLTAQQLQAAAAGEKVRFIPSGVEFVLLRSADFEPGRSGADADHQELRMILARSSEANGWDEPGMEAYD